MKILLANNKKYKLLFPSIILCCLLWNQAVFATAKEAMNIKLGTIEFTDALLSDAIRIIAEQSGVNIIATQDAGEKFITVYIQNTTVKNAVDSISRSAGLWYRYNKDTNVVLIMTTEEYQKDIVVFKKDLTKVYTLKQENVKIAAQAIEALYGDRVELSEPTGNDSESFTSTSSSTRRGGNSGNQNNNNQNRNSTSANNTDNTDTNALKNLTSAQLQVLNKRTINDEIPIVSLDEIKVVNQRIEEKIYVTYNELHNLVIVRTSDQTALTSIESLIKELDKPTPQVLLEMKILEVTLGDEFDSVFDFNGTSSSTTERYFRDDNGDVTVTPYFKRSGRLGDSIFNPASSLIGRTLDFSILNDTLGLRMQLLQRENRINTLATPILMAVNNRRAKIFIGQERTLITGASTDTVFNQAQAQTTTTIETEIRDIGTTLDISPRINDDKTVTLRIFQDNSSVAPGGTDVLIDGSQGQTITIDNVNTANMIATVIAKDGKTIAIGGMISEEEVKDVDKVPIWGDIPILGVIGSKDSRRKIKKELILLITPHIFDNADDAKSASEELTKRLSDHEYIASQKPLLDGQLGKNDRVIPGSQQHFLDLSRFAVQNLLSAGEYKQSIPGIKPDVIPIVDNINWSMKNLQGSLLSAYKQYNYYIYTVELNNISKQRVTLTPELFSLYFNDQMEAITFVDEYINSNQSSTTIFLSEKTPYELFGHFISQ